MESRNKSDQFRQTYLERLADEIRQTSAQEDLTIPFAATRVISQRLGYDLDEDQFVDGAGDRGIDFWHASDSGLYVYQVKTHEFTKNGSLDASRSFDNAGVIDLMRAHYFLVSDSTPPSNERLSRLRDRFDRLVQNYKSKETVEPLDVSLNLIVLGDNLTEGALQELEDFSRSIENPVEYDGIYLHFHVDCQVLDHILNAAWRQENHEWINIAGQKQDRIGLTPMPVHQGEKTNFLSDGKSAIFYCRAIDLVNAYNELGYQIFEPNVRANIKTSSVNDAIQKSAEHHLSMKEFRFLNNGLTITCNSYRLPRSQRPNFEVQSPGIVNGLQTVMALWKAYDSLSDYDRRVFEDDCFVLVRLLRTDAVSQISDVVLATNNQNPMQPRNLKSNASEQNDFAQYFAKELNWFYEAKQGAWDAFEKDPSRWRPPINQRPKEFKGKRGYKKVDNLDLAQNWLSFLGFADIAANEKRELFTDKYYQFIFLSRSVKHRFQNYQDIRDAIKEVENQAPNPATMLAAHLAREFANEVVPSPQANRKAALERHEGNERIGAINEDVILSNDREYILNQALNAMSLVFVEFVGYTLFREFGPDAHRYGSYLLQTPSWHAAASNLDWQVGIDKARGTSVSIENNDLLVVMWLFFREAVETLMEGAWKTSYQNSRVKTRFLLNPSQRDQLFQEAEKIDNFIQRKLPLHDWAVGIQQSEGFFGYVHRTILELA